MDKRTSKMKIYPSKVYAYITFCTFETMDKKLKRIKEVLVSQGVNQKDLAAPLEKNEYTISNWCVNKSQPHLKELYRIVGILEVDICDFLASQKK